MISVISIVKYSVLSMKVFSIFSESLIPFNNILHLLKDSLIFYRQGIVLLPEKVMIDLEHFMQLLLIMKFLMLLVAVRIS
jgi:hypothetical protein